MRSDASAASRAGRWLPAIALASLLIWILLFVAGGFTWRLGSWKFSSHRSWPALVVFFAATACSARPAVRASLRTVMASWWPALDRHASWLAIVAAVLTLHAGVQWGSFVAGGADSYGYVSQAHLLAKGELRIYQPIAHQVSWADSDWTFSPLGYRPGRRSGYIVPTYSPGLPLLMAAALKIGGEGAIFLVVPVLGALAVWCTFVLGRRVCSATTGALAAVLVAASPIFLFQLMQPMSDVPVAAWWTLAVVCALRRDRVGASLAGLAASAAILTRPNLVVLVIPFVCYLLFSDLRGRGWRHSAVLFALFTIALVPGVTAIAKINDALYGSALKSGYGSLSDIYAFENVFTNTRRYARWLLDSQSWFIALAFCSPAVAWWRSRATGDGLRLRTADSLFFLFFAAALFASYAFYLVFSDWWYIRFLLPALPVALVLAVCVAITFVSSFPDYSRAPAALILTTILAATYVAKADAQRTFTFARDDLHYVETGDYVRSALPSRAMLLAVQQSGTLRYYADRMTLRWDMVVPSQLDATLDELRQKGSPPFFVLETWEEPDFRRRFEGYSAFGRLDWPPLADIGRYIRVRIYDPSARARYLAGEEVRTERVMRPEQ